MIVRELLGRPQNISSSHGLDELLRRGMPTYAGVSVTPETAVTIAAVFACIRIVAEDIAKLPVIIYQQSTGDAKDRAPQSPYWRLLHNHPNAWQTSQQFRETMTAWGMAWGNAYAFKNAISGQVRELIPIHPSRVRVEQLEDYGLLYHVRDTQGTERPYTRREIFHLAALSLTDGVKGESVVTLARETMGGAMAQNQHASTIFGNSAVPRGVLEHPGKLNADAQRNLRDSWNEIHQGPSNANKLAILQEGMKYHPIGMSAKDSDFLASRQFSVVEIARWFRVPPHKLYELGRATWGNLEQMATEYVTDTLMSWSQRWENAFNGQVIGTNQVYAEILFDALLRGSTMERYQAYQIAAGGNAPWMSRNDIRRRENMPPENGLDEILQPMNMAQVNTDEGTKDEAPPPDRPTHHHAPPGSARAEARLVPH